MPWWRVGRERLLNGHWTRCFHSSTSWHHHRIFSFYSLQNWSPKTVEQVSASLRDRLPRLGVVGRIYLAPHPLGGINAQVSVPVSNVDELHRDLTIATRLDSLHLNPSLEDIAEPAFPKLVIKKKKLVADGFDEISCNPITHLKPQEWHQAIQQDDILLYDMRNHYEYEIGRFDKAKKIDSDTFRQGLDMLCHDLRDKKHHDVYMYCTGGIRCSIAGTYLKQRGYNPIMLEGGITAYGHWIKGQRANSLFKGKNFTFDKRRGERITHDVLVSHTLLLVKAPIVPRLHFLAFQFRMQLHVDYNCIRKDREPLVVEFPQEADTITNAQLKRAIRKQIPSLARARFSLLTQDKKRVRRGSLASSGVADGDTLYVELAAWCIDRQTADFVLCAVNIPIHLVCYFIPSIVYIDQFEHSRMQQLALTLIVLHYTKRLAEIALVHRPTTRRVTLYPVLIDAVRFWVLGGLSKAYWVYGPWFAADKASASRSEVYAVGCAAVWAWAEFSSLVTHLILRNLNGPPSKTKGKSGKANSVKRLPRGYGFDLVSCPHYFFEIVSWSSIWVLTQSFAVLLFVFAVTLHMHQLAVDKHIEYLTKLKRYPRDRKALIPFIL
ncbi:hypothetical protein BZG36_04956 [Bifiguratus adelaidae]|uniref:Rhodanese domain-containing protein n=1 Tax=Bifiguratus adelaidae TaxID=1938954 RepID=A0A261XUQ3_9FUNG|nr:hypothetical protein BZG36_04956 [Bifiguratus adelaidae]